MQGRPIAKKWDRATHQEEGGQEGGSVGHSLPVPASQDIGLVFSGPALISSTSTHTTFSFEVTHRFFQEPLSLWHQSPTSNFCILLSQRCQTHIGPYPKAPPPPTYRSPVRLCWRQQHAQTDEHRVLQPSGQSTQPMMHPVHLCCQPSEPLGTLPSATEHSICFPGTWPAKTPPADRRGLCLCSELRKEK